MPRNSPIGKGQGLGRSSGCGRLVYLAAWFGDIKHSSSSVLISKNGRVLLRV